MRKPTLLVLLSGMILGSCATGPQLICPRDEEEPTCGSPYEGVPLIPRKALFSLPAATQVSISPDGENIVYLAPVGNKLNVWVKNLRTKETKPLTRFTEGVVDEPEWIKNGKGVIFLRKEEGKDRYRIHKVELKGGESVALTPTYRRPKLVFYSSKYPYRMLLAVPERITRKTNVHMLDIKEGDITNHTHNPGNMKDWLADHEMQIRAGIATNEQGGTSLVYRETESDNWDTLRTWDAGELGELIGFATYDRTILFKENKDTDTMGLFEYDLDLRKVKKVFHQPGRSVTSMLIHPEMHTVQAVATEHAKIKWTVLDPTLKPDFDVLVKQFPDGFHITSRSRDGLRWIISTVSDVAPPRYYLYEKEKAATKLLLQERPQYSEYRFATVKPLVIRTRDGIDMLSYLTLPQGDGAQSPMVLYVHDGPRGRAHWKFDPWVQFLANRGYVVLQVNHRGSSGLGKRLLAAGGVEWEPKMQDDLSDAVKWAIATVHVDPKRIAIMGGAYGGYAALYGMANTPELYRAAVDVFGISHTFGRLRKTPVGKRPGEEEPEAEQTFKEQAENMRAPLISCHGRKEKGVETQETDRIVEAIRDENGCVRYVFFPDEGHWFDNTDNRIDFAGRVEDFLARQICGRAEPYAKPAGSTGVDK